MPTVPGALAERDPETVREFAQIYDQLAAMMIVADERLAMLAGQTAFELGAIRSGRHPGAGAVQSTRRAGMIVARTGCSHCHGSSPTTVATST